MSNLFVILSLTAFGPGDDPENAGLAQHQGTWVAVSMEREGDKTPAEIVATITRVVDGDHVTWKRDGKPFAGTSMKLDPAAEPKAIDVTPDGGPNRDKAVLGIYKLEGDTLTICMADATCQRPKEFASAKGSRQTLMTLRRVSAVTKKGC